MQTTVYVLVAKWSDNSGFRIVRVYEDKKAAEEALEIIDACEPNMHPQITPTLLVSATCKEAEAP